MTDKEILEKAIQKAIDGGWQTDQVGWKTKPDSYSSIVLNSLLDYDDINDEYEEIRQDQLFGLIFNHDFAKALWGTSHAWFTAGQSGDTIGGGFVNYLGHLANMVVSEDPIKYLGENI